MAAVLTVGELLVEVMRPEEDVPLGAVGEFLGPYPSGAPAIFADAVARLGHDSGIVGGVGDDDFGRSLLDRLERDGVDVSRVRTADREATGVAFVTYYSDGSREFIYHMANSAAGAVGPDDVPESAVEAADAVHVNGSSVLMSDRMREVCLELVDLAVERDRLVSFDPNVRPELFDGSSGDERDRQRAAVESILERADVLTPTEKELGFLAGDAVDASERSDDSSDSSDAAAAELLETGADLVAVKNGARGCSLYADEQTVHHGGFDVDVVDPTGAGDTFSAAIVGGVLEGRSLETLAAFANAAGARAVTAQGPMEGVPTRQELDAFLE